MYCWNTYPTRRRLSRARSAPDNTVISSPPRRIEPASGRSRPPRRCSIVDLPHPLGPIAATHSPTSTSSDKPRNTGRSTWSVRNDFSRPSASNKAAHADCPGPRPMPVEAKVPGSRPIDTHPWVRGLTHHRDVGPCRALPHPHDTERWGQCCDDMWGGGARAEQGRPSRSGHRPDGQDDHGPSSSRRSIKLSMGSRSVTGSRRSPSHSRRSTPTSRRGPTRPGTPSRR